MLANVLYMSLATDGNVMYLVCTVHIVYSVEYTGYHIIPIIPFMEFNRNNSGWYQDQFKA